MVDSKKKKVATRARIAHKLAKYVRASPIHISSRISSQNPSTTHLRLGGPRRAKLNNRANTWYPADDEKEHFDRKNKKPLPSKGRKSIQPGTVVILLSGKHRGRRVVVLKQLPSGNLLVTGPYAINGVCLKRVNPTLALATSTKVDLAGVNIVIDQTFFKAQKKFTKFELKNASQAKLKKVEEAKTASQKFKDDLKHAQTIVDTKLVQNIKKVEHLKQYLGTRFTLYSNSRPHLMKF